MTDVFEKQVGNFLIKSFHPSYNSMTVCRKDHEDQCIRWIDENDLDDLIYGLAQLRKFIEAKNK